MPRSLVSLRYLLVASLVCQAILASGKKDCIDLGHKCQPGKDKCCSNEACEYRGHNLSCLPAFLLTSLIPVHSIYRQSCRSIKSAPDVAPRAVTHTPAASRHPD